MHNPIFLLVCQTKMKQQCKAEEEAVRNLEAHKDFCTDSWRQMVKKKVEEIESLLNYHPSLLAELSEECECMICYNHCIENVFTCTKCEGLLCNACKMKHQQTHERDRDAEPLSCPQCRARFVDVQNPSRARRLERIIQKMLPKKPSCQEENAKSEKGISPKTKQKKKRRGQARNGNFGFRM